VDRKKKINIKMCDKYQKCPKRPICYEKKKGEISLGQCRPAVVAPAFSFFLFARAYLLIRAVSLFYLPLFHYSFIYLLCVLVLLHLLLLLHPFFCWRLELRERVSSSSVGTSLRQVLLALPLYFQYELLYILDISM